MMGRWAVQALSAAVKRGAPGVKVLAAELLASLAVGSRGEGLHTLQLLHRV